MEDVLKRKAADQTIAGEIVAIQRGGIMVGGYMPASRFYAGLLRSRAINRDHACATLSVETSKK